MIAPGPTIVVCPALAVRVGLNEAIVLQQVHYWLTSGHAHERDGRPWVYNTLAEWGKQFPFWSKSALHRVIKSLETAGLLLSSSAYNRSKTDRTKWYSVAYDHPALAGLLAPDPRISHFREMHHPIPEIGKSDKPENPMDSHVPISRKWDALPETTELTAETTTETPPTPQGERAAPKRSRNGSAPAEGFDRFWALYPRKTAKQDAVRAFGKIAPDPAALEAMLANLERQKSSDQWRRDQGRFIPHPATWLNGRRWEDDLSPPAASAEAAEEARARRRAQAHGVAYRRP